MTVAIYKSDIDYSFEVNKRRKVREIDLIVEESQLRNLDSKHMNSTNYILNLDNIDAKTSKNIFIRNIPKYIDEIFLCELFSEYGDLSSVKIIRRTYNNSGFVCFYDRKSAEEALKSLNGRLIDGLPLSLSWGKSLDISTKEHLGSIPNPKERIERLDTQINSEIIKENINTEDYNNCTIIRVEVPNDEMKKALIRLTSRFVAYFGYCFEQLLMKNELENPLFSFLFISSPLHHYYRWRVYSFLQGDSHKHWRVKPFRMVENGIVWYPPPLEEKVENDNSTRKMDYFRIIGSKLEIWLSSYNSIDDPLSWLWINSNISRREDNIKPSNIIKSLEYPNHTKNIDNKINKYDYKLINDMNIPNTICNNEIKNSNSNDTDNKYVDTINEFLYDISKNEPYMIRLYRELGGEIMDGEIMDEFRYLVDELSTDRLKIANLMKFAIDNADLYSVNILDKLIQELIFSPNNELPILYAISDILYNSYSSKPGTWKYRNLVSQLFPYIAAHFSYLNNSKYEKIIKNKMIKHTRNILRIWLCWNIYPISYIYGLESTLIFDKFFYEMKNNINSEHFTQVSIESRYPEIDGDLLREDILSILVEWPLYLRPTLWKLWSDYFKIFNKNLNIYLQYQWVGKGLVLPPVHLFGNSMAIHRMAFFLYYCDHLKDGNLFIYLSEIEESKESDNTRNYENQESAEIELSSPSKVEINSDEDSEDMFAE
ncbi:U2-associated protein SR140, putative [Cryptosporidium muris RN66]|uniref:U2-associated protein SR140, putative n=1 Tax=Cryptosporidium muris (strain RN66) TaxID=441375 RepID=B6AAY3_CRYMR|nr:U2-associated protein SR140, putative [Cryptosporidium muris RN66]EEA05535.1 U2-associated protein SR140, putative [Cryptosporidium muris RN66]|eukprot:XP_002139884.1 U2-associated protein SR140 [Cryptosporidium muris RN66]